VRWVEQELIQMECATCGEFYHLFSMKQFDKLRYNCPYCGRAGSEDDGWHHLHGTIPEGVLFVVEEKIA